MKYRHYTFITKDGARYSSMGKNRVEAQWNIEFSFNIDLTGARYEEIYKLRVVRTGIVK